MLFQKTISPKQFQEFIELTLALEPRHIIGLARMLRVEILLDEKDEAGHHLPRPFEEIYEDMLDAFIAESRTQRKEIILLLRQCKKEVQEEKNNGNDGAEDSTT